MLLARRNTVSPAVIAAAARLLRTHPEISNVELLQRLALTVGSEVASQVPITRVEKLVREPALNRIRLEDRGLPIPTEESERETPEAQKVPATKGPPAKTSGSGTPTTGSHGITSRPDMPVSDTPGESAGRRRRRRPVQASPAASSPALVNRLDPELIQAVDEALLEAFTLGADSASDAEVVEHFQDLDRIRKRVRLALESD